MIEALLAAPASPPTPAARSATSYNSGGGEDAEAGARTDIGLPPSFGDVGDHMGDVGEVLCAMPNLFFVVLTMSTGWRGVRDLGLYWLT